MTHLLKNISNKVSIVNSNTKNNTITLDKKITIVDPTNLEPLNIPQF